MKGLAGRVALVTGATGVIGGAVARRLAAEGAQVIVASRSLQGAMDWIGREEDATDRYLPGELDLADGGSVDGLIGGLGADPGCPTILVGAASSREALVSSRGIERSSFERLFSVDVAGHYLCARRIVEALPKTSVASFVFLSSVYAEVGVDHRIYPDGMSPTPVHYAAVKAGVEGLVRYLAAAWGGRGIRVNAVVAGGVENPARQLPEFVRRYSAKTMLGRLASASEIAAAVAFLASDEASYVTGSSLFVDGGFTKW